MCLGFDRKSVLLLYRRLVKLHKGLPYELRIVGDNYVRDEFKRHKNANNAQAMVFMKEWTRYYLTLAQQLSPVGLPKRELGTDLDTKQLEHLSDEQIRQLYDLKLETEKLKNNSKNSNQTQ